ncbi:formylglycine-generating enzyme family protein [Thalassospira alkalitolerans]|uniref:formylglycine-generating enzyme family protein n=2 Tax=Thalassospira alkalitolerans TaxID=1293890 RepID=UPI003AA9286E|tara:strand:- start:2840 stop:3721 length:882 start_codon:yes stop_codon:yes gene_type:complete
MIKQHWQMMERGVAGVLIAMSLQYSAMAQTENVPIPDVAEVPGGWFFQGSDSVERQYAYQIDEHVYGHDISRRNRWYDVEIDKWHIYLPTYFIMTTPVTNDQYAAFIRDTGYASPDITSEDWESLGLIYGYDATRPFAWKGDTPPRGKGNHPVVLVSWRDAQAYAQWLREKTGMRWRLPPEHYWEKAVRGPDGTFYPWGNIYDPNQLNSADRGPFETMPVGQFNAGPYGLYDGAGQVFEWTSSSSQPGYRIVKGGSWDDRGCGVCRPAARHGRAEHTQHILIGFRLMYEAPFH